MKIEIMTNKQSSKMEVESFKSENGFVILTMPEKTKEDCVEMWVPASKIDLLIVIER